jgi:hypothetical protein
MAAGTRSSMLSIWRTPIEHVLPDWLPVERLSKQNGVTQKKVNWVCVTCQEISEFDPKGAPCFGCRYANISLAGTFVSQCQVWSLHRFEKGLHLICLTVLRIVTYAFISATLLGCRFRPYLVDETTMDAKALEAAASVFAVRQRQLQ